MTILEIIQVTIMINDANVMICCPSQAAYSNYRKNPDPQQLLESRLCCFGRIQKTFLEKPVNRFGHIHVVPASNKLPKVLDSLTGGLSVGTGFSSQC